MLKVKYYYGHTHFIEGTVASQINLIAQGNSILFIY